MVDELPVRCPQCRRRYTPAERAGEREHECLTLEERRDQLRTEHARGSTEDALGLHGLDEPLPEERERRDLA